MRPIPFFILLLSFAAAITPGTARAQAQSADPDLQALREQVRQLDQQLRILARQLELKEEAATTAAKAAPKVTANDKGFSLASADGANSIKLRALVQGDSRWFVGDHVANNDAFIIRRARLIFEGTFNKNIDFQLVPEFGGTSGNGSLTLLDANIGLTFTSAFQVKVGRFREPVGLEQLQSDAVAFFAERSLVSQFVPNRDVGVQVGGELAKGTVSYAIGLFNGVADGTSNSTNSDSNDEKDVAARVFFTPFKNDPDSALAGLGFGLGGSYGRQNGAAGGLTGGYRTDGQQTWFSYRGTTVADGDVWRISPQAYYYNGPLGLLAEYVVTSAEAVNGANRTTVKNNAWQLSSGYVLTGEDAGYRGVTPRESFNWDNGTWGAFEVVGRVAQANIDDAVFTAGALSLANPANSAESLTTYGLGLNWYLNKVVRASFDYFHGEYKLLPGVVPATTAVVHDDENAFVTRLQLSF